MAWAERGGGSLLLDEKLAVPRCALTLCAGVILRVGGGEIVCMSGELDGSFGVTTGEAGIWGGLSNAHL